MGRRCCFAHAPRPRTRLSAPLRSRLFWRALFNQGKIRRAKLTSKNRLEGIITRVSSTHCRLQNAYNNLQVKAALALLYDVLGATNPFAEYQAPKFAPEKIVLRYHTASQLGQLLRDLREDRRSYFGHLTYHLATTLFFTRCRFHEWARLTLDRLVREPTSGMLIAARLQVKGGLFRDLPLTKELAASLEEWFAFLESVKGVRLRGWGE
jgi:integrase